MCVHMRVWRTKGVTTLGVCACVWRPKDSLECRFSEAVHLVFCVFTGLKFKFTKLAGIVGQ